MAVWVMDRNARHVTEEVASAMVFFPFKRSGCMSLSGHHGPLLSQIVQLRSGQESRRSIGTGTTIITFIA